MPLCGPQLLPPEGPITSSDPNPQLPFRHLFYFAGTILPHHIIYHTATVTTIITILHV